MKQSQMKDDDNHIVNSKNDNFDRLFQFNFDSEEELMAIKNDGEILDSYLEN